MVKKHLPVHALGCDHTKTRAHLHARIDICKYTPTCWRTHTHADTRTHKHMHVCMYALLLFRYTLVDRTKLCCVTKPVSAARAPHRHSHQSIHASIYSSQDRPLPPLTLHPSPMAFYKPHPSHLPTPCTSQQLSCLHLKETYIQIR